MYSTSAVLLLETIDDRECVASSESRIPVVLMRRSHQPYVSKKFKNRSLLPPDTETLQHVGRKSNRNEHRTTSLRVMHLKAVS